MLQTHLTTMVVKKAILPKVDLNGIFSAQKSPNDSGTGVEFYHKVGTRNFDVMGRAMMHVRLGDLSRDRLHRFCLQKRL